MAKNNGFDSQALERQARKGQEVLTQNAQQFHDGNETMQRLIEAAEFVGSANAVQRIADSLNAQAIQAWELFQQEEKYRAYGCTTFVEFLERHSKLGLTKTRYYERKQLLSNEGAEVFDLLNTLQIPFKVRRQLTAGSIQIEGNQLTVNDQTVSLEDTKKVKRAIADLAEQMERLEGKAAKSEKEVEKLKKKLDDAKEIAREAASAVPFNDNTDPANQAYMRVVASLTELTRELCEMDAEEGEGRLASYRPGIQQAIENCFAFASAQSPTRKPKNETGLTNEDLADLMED